MSDRRAEYSRDYQTAAEQPSYAPKPSSTVAPTQRDLYEQPQHPVLYNFWAPYTSGRGAPSSLYAGLHADVVNPAWSYGGGQYGEPSVGFGAADPYSGTRKRCASDPDERDAGREYKR